MKIVEPRELTEKLLSCEGMKTRKMSFVFSVWLLVGLISLLSLEPRLVAGSKVLKVPRDYPSIQKAINAASFGDTILVAEGTYHEQLELYEKSLSIIGQNKWTTIIDGNGTYNVIIVAESFVTISGFTIKNGYNGINIWDSNNTAISGNVISANTVGVSLSGVNFSMVSGNIVTSNNLTGIALSDAYNNTITSNIISMNQGNGVGLVYSSNNTIMGNTINSNPNGAKFIQNSMNNTIVGNVIINSTNGIVYEGASSGNLIHHNNFVNNTKQTISVDSVNRWDNGYPSGGNYWSDYTGVDVFSGPYQNITGSDEIRDTPYVIDANNQDRYPLMKLLIAPTANFAWSPDHPLVGKIVTFDASGSLDPDGSIVDYMWDFGDGHVTTVTTSNITHVYAAQGNYTVDLTVTDNDGLSDSINKSVTVIVDSGPPTTLHDYDGLWHTTDFTITLIATDDLSGVAETYYQLNDDPLKTVNADGQPHITTEGANNTLEYWSTDVADNTETPHKMLISIKLDKANPSISFVTPSNGSQVTSSTISVTWTGSDETSGISLYQVRLDSGSFIDIGNTTYYEFTNVDDGAHQISVKAFDNADRSRIGVLKLTVNTSASRLAKDLEMAKWFVLPIVFAIIALIAFQYRKKRMKGRQRRRPKV